MGVLADINVHVNEILAYIEGDDDDDWEAAEEEEDPSERIERLMAEDETHQALLRMIERAKIELATGKRPPPDFDAAKTLGARARLLGNERSRTMIQNTIQPGEPVEHRGIVVAPLFPRRDPAVSYITLDEALPRGLEITEIDDSGSVPELIVQNPLDTRVLLYDGEELVGARQNRILNVSVLVDAKSALNSGAAASAAHAPRASTARLAVTIARRIGTRV